MFAVRNIKMCTKDCLCLYVCPTGASDTEDGQVDRQKCIGCGACVNACPSKALSLVPDEMPPQQSKDEKLIATMFDLVRSKAAQEVTASNIADKENTPYGKQIAQALIKANRLMAEDLAREAGFMLPQSRNTKQFLEELLKDTREDFPKDTVEELLKTIRFNETDDNETEKWQCVCGYIYEGKLPEDFVCPICGQPASAFEKIDVK